MTPYTDEQRAEAIQAYIEHGSAEAERRTGISARSIRRWANDAGLSQARAQRTEAAREQLARQHEQMREEFRVRLLEQGLQALERIDEPHIEFKGNTATRVEYPNAPSDAFQRYATSAAILIDKYRLEMGEHTSHNRTEGTDDIDRSVAQLIAELDRKRQSETA